MSEYEVHWPLARSTGETVAMNPRFAAGGAKRIGFVWDYVFRGDEMFEVLQEELSKRFPGSVFVPYETFGNMHGHDEREVLAALPDILRREELDAVIAGVGA
jgi:hypothetical protein